jgi:glycosyltransferase involved in cell wall biosynthesis
MTDIHVLIPSYNCAQWIERCLDSVAKQEHAPKQVLVIDDASSDPDYADQCLRLLDQHAFLSGKTNWRFIRNMENMKCPYNLRLGIRELAPKQDDIIFLLDGDDFLPHEGVFTRIAEVYEDPEVWLTYGNYEPFPHNTGQVLAHAYPRDVIKNRSFRTAAACFNHPLTFRKHLWDHVTDADMQTKDGRWFTGGYDMVIMSPMFELATPKKGYPIHWRFLDETLYSYNAVNPISDSTVNVHLVEESREMMRRPKKEPL